MTRHTASSGPPPVTATSISGALWTFTAVACALAAACGPVATTPEARGASAAAVRRDARLPVRLAGTVEAVRAFSVNVPRLTGQSSNVPLVITRLAAGGARVEAGDVLVEFDPQEQQSTARDRRSALLDLEGRIRRLTAEQEAARATDEAELVEAANDVERSRLDVRTNPLLPRIEAEMNDLALEQAIARLEQLERTFALKRAAAAAELRILEIQRDRAWREAEHAERNARLMTVASPFDGLVVIETIFRGGGQMTEVQEGEELRSGVPVLDVVDPSQMQVRASVNQTDIAHVEVGQPARVGLDAYPELAFDGTVEQIAPLAVPSQLTPTVRSFAAIVSIAGSHERLTPDLSASVDILPAPRTPASARARQAAAPAADASAVRRRPSGAVQRGVPAGAPGGGLRVAR